MQLATMARCF